MDARIYPTVSNEIMKSTELAFDKYFIDILNEILIEDTLKELCEERHNALMESIFDRHADSSYFTSVLQRYLNPNSIQTKKSIETLILCYAHLGVIPVTQAKLGAVIEQFIHVSGGWKTKTVKYTDAMKFRLPGSFENGKR